MPFSSKVQMRKMALLVKQGKLQQSTYDEWAAATDIKKLPERIKGKKGAKVPVKKTVKRTAKKKPPAKKKPLAKKKPDEMQAMMNDLMKKGMPMAMARSIAKKRMAKKKGMK